MLAPRRMALIRNEDIARSTTVELVHQGADFTVERKENGWLFTRQDVPDDGYLWSDGPRGWDVYRQDELL